MASKEIEIMIDQEGMLSADLKGFEGKQCSKAIDELLKAIGKSGETKKKKEYFLKPKKVKIKGKIGR